MLQLIPKGTGFRGDIDAAMREAKATEFNDVTRLVRDTLRGLIHQDKDRWIDVVAIYANEVVIELNSKFWMYGYSIDEGNRVVLQSPKEVVREYSPVGITNLTEASAGETLNQHVFVSSVNGPLREAAADKKGLKWRISVIESGMSLNNNLYPEAVLREAVPLFVGATVCSKSDRAHLTGADKSVDNIIGKLESPVFIEASGANKARIEATLVLLPVGDTQQKLTAMYEADMTQSFGFSIDVVASAVKKKRGTQHIVEAVEFTKVNSVDLIVEPGAGGRLLEMKEAKGANTMQLLQRMVEAIKKQDSALLTGVDVENEDSVFAVYEKMVEALAKPAVEPQKPADDAGDGNGVTQTQLKEALGVERARTFAVSTLNTCNLPAQAVTQLQAQFDADEGLTNTRVTEAVANMQDLVSSLGKSGHIQMGQFMHANVDDGKQLLEALLDKDNKDVTSLREAYIECTGDKGLTGHTRNCSKSRMAEALDSTDFPNALGESMHKRMMELWKNPTIYDNWRAIADVVPVSDFRNQERIAIGGYGDLSIVAESGNYPALTSPSDMKERYKIQKRGGTENVTLEMIINDDVGALQRIPQKMVGAAKRTMSKFVWDFFESNPNMEDSNAWFHASRNNLGTSALSAAAISAARIALMRQKEIGSEADLGLIMKYLMVPPELEEQARDLFKRDTNLDETFIQSLNPTIIPVASWSDLNNWVVSADPSEIPVVEMGFFQGNEEPELFIQDNPTVGSMFTNDSTTYKIRHIYGGAPLSGQGVFKNVVV